MIKKPGPDPSATLRQSRRAEWRELQLLDQELREKRRRSQERLARSRQKFDEARRKLWDKAG